MLLKWKEEKAFTRWCAKVQVYDSYIKYVQDSMMKKPGYDIVNQNSKLYYKIYIYFYIKQELNEFIDWLNYC